METTEEKIDTEPVLPSPSKAERDATIEAINHLIQGKRHLLVQDIPSAVASLQEACQLLASCYGEIASECGEAYYYYGKALLELARDESSVLGNAIGGEDKDDDDDDDEDEDEEKEDENESEDDDEEESESADQDKNEADNSKEAEKKDEDKEKEKENVPPIDSQPGPSTSTGEDGKKEEQEDITNLQLAWEMLELAKLIFSRESEGNEEKQLKLSEIHLQLGEVSLESENYEQAIEEFKQCLKIQSEFLPPESRLLAETHYQLGLAHSFHNLFDESVEHFNTAYHIMEDKIATLSVIAAGKEMEKEPDIMGDRDPVKEAKKEIEELKALLPEIKDKVTDTEDMKKNAIDAMKNAAISASSLFSEEAERKTDSNDVATPSSSSESAPPKPVSNISHLVKRKRKPDEVEGSDQKKIRCQDGATTSDVSSTSEASTSGPVKEPSASNEVETSSSITSSEEAKRESRSRPEPDEGDCIVTSAGRSSGRRLEEAKVADNDHCDSVHNGETIETNVFNHPSSLSSEVNVVDAAIL